MNQQQLRRFGLIGLVLLGLLAVVYLFTNYQKSKTARRVPPDDRVVG